MHTHILSMGNNSSERHQLWLRLVVHAGSSAQLCQGCIAACMMKPACMVHALTSDVLVLRKLNKHHAHSSSVYIILHAVVAFIHVYCTPDPFYTNASTPHQTSQRAAQQCRQCKLLQNEICRSYMTHQNTYNAAACPLMGKKGIFREILGDLSPFAFVSPVRRAAVSMTTVKLAATPNSGNEYWIHPSSRHGRGGFRGGPSK